MKVSRDSYGHWPDNENFDLVITPSNQSHGVVAAAHGVVAFIEEDYDEKCPQGESGDCNDNYVWLVHAGGEWTKYSHVAKDSVRLFAGLSEGDVVLAGLISGGWLKGHSLAPRFCNVPGQVLAQGVTCVAAPCDQQAAAAAANVGDNRRVPPRWLRRQRPRRPALGHMAAREGEMPST
ncbi:hypothetical protein [Luteitalea sp.]